MVGPIINSGKEFYCGPIPDEIESKFKGLIGSFKDVFVSGELKEFTVSDQDGFPIYTDGSPIFEVSSLSRADKERLVWKVNELLKSGYLERSNSEWSSPVRPKTINGKLEICVDYRSLNAITQDYEDIVLPTIPDVLSSISQSNIFSKIVLKDVYHQLMLGKNSRKKTAFWIDGVGQFQFKTFHHGLRSADYALQMTIDEVLEYLGEGQVKAYREQILVHTNGHFEHLDMLRHLFRVLRAVNIKVDVEKSRFLERELVFLGKTISESGIGISSDQLDKIQSFQTPRSKSEVRSFLGLISQHKSYVNDFDYLAHPLRYLTHPNSSFYWGLNENNAFVNLKRQITSTRPIPLQQFY